MVPALKWFSPATLPLLLLSFTFSANSQDTITIHNIGHASLCFEYKGTVIHVDPYSSQTDYSEQPDADLILITHGHQDHYDASAFNQIKKESTIMVCPPSVAELETYSGAVVTLENGDTATVAEYPIEAVPAYNLTRTNHPKGVGNGYILTLGKKRIYIAGDTELTPEMESLGAIDIAFIPMNLPYTMSVEMAAEAVKTVNPDIAYIYHFSSSDTAALRTLLQDEDVEIRIGSSTFQESDGSETVGTVPERHGRSNHPNTNGSDTRYQSRHAAFSNNEAAALNLRGQVIGDPYLQPPGIRSFSPGVYLLQKLSPVAEPFFR